MARAAGEMGEQAAGAEGALVVAEVHAVGDDLDALRGAVHGEVHRVERTIDHHLRRPVFELTRL
ncbi:MAG: hypothetical protein KDB51_06340 [Propionibacteriaceae bacterium]|nr:hypothetical protein [Propionibacteriaceae bacterium]